MRIVPAAFVAAFVLALSGCVPSPPPVTLPPQPTAAPVFASEEEALEAAEESYRAYQNASDEILRDGGADPSRVGGLVTGELAAEDQSVYSVFFNDGRRIIGGSEVKRFVLQRFDPLATDGIGVVTAYVCLDVTSVDVLDKEGASLVSPDRPGLQAFEVAFDWVGGERLLPSTRLPWPGGGVC